VRAEDALDHGLDGRDLKLGFARGLQVEQRHRGYLLDRELSEREFLFRDEDDYISKYRRVLDHFDAVKIGLTATPALHTREIFGAPVFSYSYREAVIDGFLVDHEPPVRIVTKLAQDGIHYAAQEEVLVLAVDLLTTGVDVPKIANLVFLRRVRSRILYEQMIGRATRLCEEIGKERERRLEVNECGRTC
jgi:type I site-specific restriction endonuclease